MGDAAMPGHCNRSSHSPSAHGLVGQVLSIISNGPLARANQGPTLASPALYPTDDSYRRHQRKRQRVLVCRVNITNQRVRGRQI